MKFDGVAKTALFVAAIRATEGKRKENPLFIDPYAEILAGEEGKSLLQKALDEVGEQPVIPLRTKFIDDRMMTRLSQGIKQVVILAAGMDSRAFRLTYPVGTRIYELDRQEVLDYKEEKLNGHKAHATHFSIGHDLREDWTTKLSNLGHNPNEKTIWLVEGLLMYLDESSVQTLIQRVSNMSAEGSTLFCDIIGKTLMESPYMEKQLAFLAGLGAPWKFATDEPEKFFEGFGWKAEANQPGELFPARWPFPVAPRSVPNVPRSFFVEAIKA